MNHAPPPPETGVTAPGTAEEIAEFTPAGASPPPLLTLFALALASAMAVSGIAAPEQFMSMMQWLNDRFMDAASGAVVVVSSLILLLCLGLAVSPLGRIRLGQPGDTPEFSRLTWVAMLFAAGMGAGLLYWGVAEPVTHLTSPPHYDGAMAAAGDARMAMVLSYLHWALHPWGLYAAGALCIAYFSFCKGRSMLPSAPFRAVLPARLKLSHSVGDIVDVACVLALLLGLSASMAAGTMQIASGTRWLGNTAASGQMFPTYMTIVVLLVAAYLTSALSGLHRGIRRLSELNMAMAVLLAALICFTLSAADVLATLARSVTDYLRFLPELSFAELGADDGSRWGETWTANYFLSWIAWVPFVGIFVARISRGRTIREFVCGAILAPSAFTFVWFAILGGAALDVQLGGVRDLAADVAADSGAGLFSLLSLFPGAEFLWMLVVVLVFVFLVTSADSASYVLAMMAGRGEANPSAQSKLFWGLAIAALTSATLFSESGIHSVRAVFSFAGIAVFFILIGMVLCLCCDLLRRPPECRK